MKKQERRLDLHQISAEQYISRHYIEVYFKDVVEQMLECKAEGIKVDPIYMNTLKVLKMALIHCLENSISFVQRLSTGNVL